jgi:hypothetical protein
MATMIGFDLGTSLVDLWGVWKKDKEFQAWIRLILSTVYSAIIAFLGVDGAVLVAGQHWLVAMGSGFVAASVSITGILLRDPQGKKLMLSLPEPVVAQVQIAENKGQVTINTEAK